MRQPCKSFSFAQVGVRGCCWMWACICSIQFDGVVVCLSGLWRVAFNWICRALRYFCIFRNTWWCDWLKQSRGYAHIFCGNAELAAAQYYLSRNPELKGSEEDVIASLTYNECLLQAQEEQKNFSLLQTEMEEMRTFQRLLASYLKIICSLQNESHRKKREKVQIRKICIALNEISESYVGSVFVAYFDFSNADNRHIFKKDIIRMAPQIKKFDFGKMKLSVKVKAELFLWKHCWTVRWKC